MKDGFFYPDVCVVSRSLGETDADGVELFDEVYSGKCGLYPSGILGNTRFDGFQFEHEPYMFIPVNDILFQTNDLVQITAHSDGRQVRYTIKNFEAVNNSGFEELNNTVVWLKDGISDA